MVEAMSTNQTIDGVPRQMISVPLDALKCYLSGDGGDWVEAGHELRALLDADKCTSCDGSGEYIDAIGDWRGYCVCPAGVALENEPADQPQGEPVAVFSIDATGYRCRVTLDPSKGLPSNGTKLYAEQPAPVAVALPERKHVPDFRQHPMLNKEYTGWNACLDEVARLTATVRIPEPLVMTDGLHTYEYVTGHNAAIDKMLGVKS